MFDKRKFMRFDAFMDIFYELVGSTPAKIKSRLKNISREGIGAAVKENMNPGANVELEIYLPEKSAPPILARGEVIWCKHGSTQGYEVGLRFTNITSENKTRLLDFAYEQWLRANRLQLAPKDTVKI